MTRAIIVALLVAGAVLAPVRAQQSSPRSYTVYATGTSTCRWWLEVRRTGPHAAYLELSTWMTGFVSGYGYGSGQRLKVTSAPQMEASVDQYCQTHPLDDVADALQAFVQELHVKAP